MLPRSGQESCELHYRSQELGICVKHAIDKTDYIEYIINITCVYTHMLYLSIHHKLVACDSRVLTKSYQDIYQQYTNVGVGVCVTLVSKFQTEVCSLCRLPAFCSNYCMCLLAVNAMMLH